MMSFVFLRMKRISNHRNNIGIYRPVNISLLICVAAPPYPIFLHLRLFRVGCQRAVVHPVSESLGERKFMHEYGIAEELAVAVKRAISGHGDNRVVRIVVEAGAGALEHGSLDLAFAHASEGTNFANAELIIQKAERMYHCLDCGIDFSNSDSPSGICPSCKSSETISAPSHDITLKSVEIED